METELRQIAVPEEGSGRSSVDKLVKLTTKHGAELYLYLHIEVQSQLDPLLPSRMFTYSYRIRDKYKQMPLSFAINGDDSPTRQDNFYEEVIYGCKVRFDFESVKLIDYRDREEMLEQSDNPFAAVVLAHLKTLETHGNPRSRVEWKLRLIRRLLHKGLDKEKTRLLFRVIDDMMKLSGKPKIEFNTAFEKLIKEQNMPLISEFELDAMNKGMEKGRTEGLLKGIEMGLEVKFGDSGLVLMSRISLIEDNEILEKILSRLRRTDNIDEIRALIPIETV